MGAPVEAMVQEPVNQQDVPSAKENWVKMSPTHIANAVPEPWFSFLEELDEMVTGPVEMVCLGGFVVSHFYGSRRNTEDVDVLQIAPRSTRGVFAEVADKDGKLHDKYGVYLDQRATVAVQPYEFESRFARDVSGNIQKSPPFCPRPV